MPDEKYTNGDAVDIIENEGLSYAVQHYCDSSYFEDPITAGLWSSADAALGNLERYLKRQTGREF